MKEKNKQHLNLAHTYWKSYLQEGDLAIDATCGNGHDSHFLAKLLLPHPDSLLIAFDIQASALENTERLLKKEIPEEHLSRVLFHRRCHTEVNSIPLPRPPKLVVYNLGYLPGADKTLTTQTASTLQSVQNALTLFEEKGAVSITCYPGHPEGKAEEEALLDWAKSLPSDVWHVCHHRWLNRASSPSLLWITKNS